MRDAATILRDVRALITPPERWTQGAPARRKNGKPIHPEAKNAICWSVSGACRKYGVDISDFAFDLLCGAAKELYLVESADYVNNNLGHAAVLKMVDLAIAMAEGE